MYAMHQTLKGTLHLLEVYKDTGVEFINVSTHSVYGRPVYALIDEAHPRHPTTLYGALKLGQEALVDAYVEAKGFKAWTLRASTMFGEYDRRGALVYEFLLKALSSRPFEITGDGTQGRDLNYVGNFVDAILLTLKRGLSGNAFNVGSGEFVSINALAEACINLVGSRSVIEHVPARPGEEGKLVLNMGAANVFFGYKPKVDFETGLGRMLEWIRR